MIAPSTAGLLAIRDSELAIAVTVTMAVLSDAKLIRLHEPRRLVSCIRVVASLPSARERRR
jgi:hypothetical protein